MMYPVIEAKIKAPATYPNYLRRAVVSTKLKQLFRSPLTLIHGGAGYGKTSLLSHVLHDEKKRYSWYTAQEEDDDLQPFLLYLMASIERVIPGTDDEFKNKRTLAHYPKQADIQEWIMLFIEAMNQIDEDFVIVIDDYHTIDHVFSINYFMEKVLTLLPEHIHIVLSSRQKPRWSNLLKLRSSGRLIEIVSEDLQFQIEEIHYFFEDTYQLHLAPEVLQEVFRVTEGWAIAVQLVGNYLSSSREDSFSLPDLPTDELFHYLAQEVVAKRTSEEQHMLYHLSLMESFDMESIRHFYGEDGKRLLDELLRAHMFLLQIGVSHYRFHALFQQFLQTTFKEKYPDDWLHHHQQLADYFSLQQNVIKAMNHFRIVNDREQIATKLLSFGPELIKNGQFDYLHDLIEQVPAELKKQHYTLYQLLGEVLRYKAYYEKAKKAYEFGAQLAVIEDDFISEAKNMIGIASIYIDTIQPLYAEPYLEKALGIAETTNDLDEKTHKEWKWLRIENLVNLGKAKEAEEWMARFDMQMDDLPAHNIDVRLHLRRGRLTEAKTAIVRKKQDANLLPEMFRDGTVLGSFICAMLGDRDEALRLADRGIQLGKEERSVYIEAVGYVRKGHAHFIAPVRELQDAYTCYQKAIDLLSSFDLNRAKAEPLMGLAAVHGIQGVYDQASEAYDAAIRETEKVQDSWLSAYLFVGRGHIYKNQGEFKSSSRDFQSAFDSFHRCGDVFGEFISLFHLLFSQWEQGEEVERDLFQQLINLLLTHHFEFFITRHTLFGLFEPASSLPFFYSQAKNLPTNRRQELFKKIGIVEQISPPAYTLHIQLLGAFDVKRGKVRIIEKEWQREKAKELFTLFVLNRTRYMNKQEIYDELWPYVEHEQAERDFKVTYNALLKAIEPAREARQESFFIERKGLLYRIRPEARLTLDIDEWKSSIEKANSEREPSASLTHLKKASTYYQGEIFGDRIPDSKMIRREQDSFRTAQLEVMERIAQLYTRLQEYNKVVYWAEKILAEEQTWEEAYRLLMFAYYQKKNRRRALELYSKCSEVLLEELGVSPMETTENMYELIRL